MNGLRTCSAYDSRANTYATAALQREVDNLRSTVEGRACAAFRSAAALGGLVASGYLDGDSVTVLLLDAALATGLPEREARREIRRGLARGAKAPRVVPTASFEPRRTPLRPARRTVQPAPPAPTFPPFHELQALWSLSRPVSTDDETRAWLHSRYRDRVTAVTALVEMWDLARVIPLGASLPSWASTSAGPWNRTRHRLLFRLWDEHGQFRSVRARSLSVAARLKSLAPTDFSIAGLLLADTLAVQLLAAGAPPWWTDRTIVISEGEPDWIAWAARHGDGRADGPAYFGIIAGSWTRQLADRIPTGARVIVRTHHDAQGDRYAYDIIRSLRDRCPVLRSRAQGGVDE